MTLDQITLLGEILSNFSDNIDDYHWDDDTDVSVSTIIESEIDNTKDEIKTEKGEWRKIAKFKLKTLQELKTIMDGK